MVTKETYTTGTVILIKPETARRVGCVIKKPSLPDSDGKYRVKAGTPLYTSEALTEVGIDRSKALSDTEGGGSAAGVLYEDVVFKDKEGEANGTLVINGMVDYLKLDSTVQAKITTDVETKLPHIQFVRGRAD